MTAAGRRRRRHTVRVVATASAVLAVGAAAAAATGFGLPDGEGASEAHSALPPASAQVTRQTLVDTQNETGELGYGATIGIPGRLNGTVTALPAIGATIKRGQSVYRVDNTPVVLLYGTLPAYRELAVGIKGADVKQFEQNLYALGYRGFTVDTEYSSSTASAVKEWQEDLGLTETGRVELGRVHYTAGQIRVDTLTAKVGEALQPGGEVLAYTGSARLIIAKLDMSDQRLAVKGATVGIRLPDGKPAEGKIASFRTVVDTDSSNSGPAGDTESTTVLEVTITVTDEKVLAGLDEATVQVSFTASKRENVFTVPVGALLALAEGGYGVQIVEGTAARIVAVKTGLFASGRVEVSGEGLTEGMTVGMPT